MKLDNPNKQYAFVIEIEQRQGADNSVYFRWVVTLGGGQLASVLVTKEQNDKLLATGLKVGSLATVDLARNDKGYLGITEIDPVTAVPVKAVKA
jgi:uncharacterized membrane protein YebE (DUF533 family)